MARRPGGGGGERGGGAAPLFPSPPSWGAARGPRPCPPSSPAQPPWVYTSRRALVGAGRGPIGRRWVSAGGGGEVSSLRPAPLPSPGRHQSGLPRLRIPGRHRAVSAHGTGEAVWGTSPIPAAQPVALFARLAQEFSWADYGISISVGFL